MKLIFIRFSSVYIILTTAENNSEPGCLFDLNKSIPTKPVLLYNELEPRIIYPSEFNVLKLWKGFNIKLECISSKFTRFNSTNLVAECVENDLVKVGKRIIKFRTLECEHFPKSIIYNTGLSCNKNHALIHVGFNITGKFLKLFHVCFNTVTQNPSIVWLENSNVHLGRQSKIRRPFFSHDNLYDFDINRAYSRKKQLITLSKILNSTSRANYFINYSESFLARGHLLPKADFVYGFEQAATFHYINSAPQWQQFNAGNWLKLEENIRNLLKEQQNRYKIMTGTYGVLTLPNRYNEPEEIYLHVKGEKKIPVPLYFWKSVYDTEISSGVVIIGINNPHLKKIPENYIVCSDICDQIEWMNFHSNNTKRGFIFCCTDEEFFSVTEFSNIVKNLNL